MNIQDIQNKVKEIEKLVEAHTPWKAHALEDALSKEFIEMMSRSGVEPYRSMAVEILRSHKMDFDRWYE